VKLVNIYLPGRSKKTSTKSTKQEEKGKEQADTKSRIPRLSSFAAYHLPEDYPLVRTFTLYVSPNAGPTAKDFAQFVATDHCAETLFKHNLLPPIYTGTDRGTAPREKSKKPYLGNRR
jgi:hypothetical protein